MSTREFVEEWQGDLTGRKVLLQLSGGRDSCALLVLLSQTGVFFEAIHFVHRYASAIPRRMAASICRRYDVPLHEVEMTAELLDSLSAHPYDRPCRHCKAIMDRLSAEYAAAHGFDCIAVGDKSDDTALLNRLENGRHSVWSHYFNARVTLPDGIRIFRPLLSWDSGRVASFLAANDIAVERNGDTGDKYVEYSREGCPLQFKDYGAPFDVDLMEKLVRYNELCALFARDKGIRASVHLPSGNVVTIPCGHENDCREYLLAHGCELPRVVSTDHGGCCCLLSIPRTNAMRDIERLAPAVSRLSERLEIPLDRLSYRWSADGRFLDLVIDADEPIPEARLQALAIEVFHTRMMSVAQLSRSQSTALLTFPPERHAQYKAQMAFRLLAVFGPEFVDWLGRHGFSALHFAGNRDLYDVLASNLRGIKLSFSTEPPEATRGFCPVSIVSAMESVLLETVSDYCTRRNIQLIVCTEEHQSRLPSLTQQEDFYFELGRDIGNPHRVPLVDESFFTMAETVETPSFAVSDGIRRTVPDVLDRDDVVTIHVFGNCVAFGLCVDDPYTIASHMQSILGTDRGVRVVNHGAPAGLFPLNTLSRCLMEPMRSGDVAVLIDWFDPRLLQGRDDVFALHQWYGAAKTAEDSWFWDSELHPNENGTRFLAERLVSHVKIAASSKIDNFHCNALSYLGRAVDMSRHADVLSPYVRNVVRFAAAAVSRNVPLYYPPPPEGFSAPSRRLEYVRSIVDRYAPGLLPLLPEEKKPSVRRLIQLVIHSTVSPAALREVKDRLGALGEIAGEGDVGAAVVHYGLDGRLGMHSSFHFYIDSPDEIDAGFKADLGSFFALKKTRTLLYLGKFPSGDRDVDGGSQMARQLICTLRDFSTLDVTFIRKSSQVFSSPGVANVRYVKYLDPDGNKFQRRIENIGSNKVAVQNGVRYDLVVAAHCSKLFGLSDDLPLMAKAVVFPMFLSASYRRAGEVVPEAYAAEERKVLERVSQIITPSEDERDDILSDTKTDGRKIRVIPRSVDPLIVPVERSVGRVELVSIASIKRQKNHTGELRVLKELRQRGVDAHLSVVGDVYDRDEWLQLRQLVDDWSLETAVTWFNCLDRVQIAETLRKMTFGISTSRWETFGRGIFECLASGLPTVLPDSLKTVKGRLGDNSGAVFCADEAAMVDAIERMAHDQRLYRKLSRAAARVGELYASAVESERLVYALLAERNRYSTKFTNWHAEDCEVVYSGRYSECWRLGGRLRKYVRFDNRQQVEREFVTARNAWRAGVRTPRPVYCAWDSLQGKWFIEFEFVRTVDLGDWNLADYEGAFSNLVLLRNIAAENLWQAVADDLVGNLQDYGRSFAASVESEIAFVRQLVPMCTVHGDFTPRNLARGTDGEVFVFDFQCATLGPQDWDENYLLANFDPEELPGHILAKANPRYVSVVLKVRIARALRKNEPVERMLSLLRAWNGQCRCCE